MDFPGHDLTVNDMEHKDDKEDAESDADSSDYESDDWCVDGEEGSEHYVHSEEVRVTTLQWIKRYVVGCVTH